MRPVRVRVPLVDKESQAEGKMCGSALLPCALLRVSQRRKRSYERVEMPQLSGFSQHLCRDFLLAYCLHQQDLSERASKQAQAGNFASITLFGRVGVAHDVAIQCLHVVAVLPTSEIALRALRLSRQVLEFHFRGSEIKLSFWGQPALRSMSKI